jgi:hypothetical protein
MRFSAMVMPPAVARQMVELRRADRSAIGAANSTQTLEL